MWGRLAVWAVAINLALGILGSTVGIAAQDDPRLDELFAQLKNSDNKNEAADVTDEIWFIWRHSGIPPVDWMMEESHQFLRLGILDSALGGFTLVTESAPDFAEGWHRRSTVYFLMGNFLASIEDIQRTVSLEPRHFGAFAGLGLIYLKMGNEHAALKALEKALEINPHLYRFAGISANGCASFTSALRRSSRTWV
jgi:tetratricopeptide (TPR) repeat protein